MFQPSSRLASQSKNQEDRKIASQSTDDLIPRIERFPRRKELPVTMMEQIVLEPYLHTREGCERPERAPFAIRNCFRLTGKFNPIALKQSIREAARRHQAMHSILSIVEGRPARVIASDKPLPLEIVDLSDIADAKKRLEMSLKLMSEDHQRPFNLIDSLLWKCILLRLKHDDFLAFFRIDHLICDGWSMNVILQDIRSLYFAYSSGQYSPLPELAIELADFAFWQQRHIQGERMDRLNAYRQSYLSGVGIRPGLHLINENPMPCTSGLRPFESQQLSVSSDVRESLSKMSRREGVTLPATLTAALISLLYHYSQKQDIGITLVYNNRHRSEFRKIVGWLAGEYELHIKVCGCDTFSQLLRQVQIETLEANDNIDLPKFLFPGYANSSFCPSIHVNIQVGTEYWSPKEFIENPILPKLQFRIKGVEVPRSGPARTMEPGMFIIIRLNRMEIDLDIDYEIERYKATVITELLDNYGNVLRTVMTDPTKKISDLPISITK